MGIRGLNESSSTTAAVAGLNAVLGSNPQGSSATVKARLDALDVTNNRQSIARTAATLLACAANRRPDPLPVASGVTVTWGTAGAAPTIASAVRIAPKRTGSTIDVANDPNFLYVGAIPGRLVTSSGDMTYPDYLTGGTVQARRNITRISFVHSGAEVEVYIRARTTSTVHRFWVDGLPVTATMQTQATTANQRYYIKLSFSSSAARTISVELADQEFGGVAIAPTDTVTRPRRGLTVAGLGDSHMAGANGVTQYDAYLNRLGWLLSVDTANLAIGGSGFLNGNPSAAFFRNRISTDLAPVAPEVVVFEGSWNDDASSSTALAAEAAYCYQTIRAALPAALLVAAGPWVLNHTQNTTMDLFDAALRAEAEAAGWNGYISFRDPLRLLSTAQPWATATAYIVGDVVSYNGFAQVCVSGHTSAAWDQTKWRSTAIVNGTGRVGATAGNGNADVIVSNDGIHATLLGHQIKARFVADELIRIAEAVATGQTWAA